MGIRNIAEGLLSVLLYYGYSILDKTDDMTSDLKDTLYDAATDTYIRVCEYKAELETQFFASLDILTLEDPYTEGKAEGYCTAAKYYEQIYNETKHAYEIIINKLDSEIQDYDVAIREFLEILDRKKEEFENFKKIENAEKKRVSKLKNCSIDDLDRFTAFPKNRSLLEIIVSPKLKKYRHGQCDGYDSAKNLFQQRINELLQKSNKIIEEKSVLSQEYAQLYREILTKQFAVAETIISLELVK